MKATQLLVGGEPGSPVARGATTATAKSPVGISTASVTSTLEDTGSKDNDHPAWPKAQYGQMVKTQSNVLIRLEYPSA